MFPSDNSTVVLNSTATSSDTTIGSLSQAVYNAIGLGKQSLIIRFQVNETFRFRISRNYVD